MVVIDAAMPAVTSIKATCGDKTYYPIGDSEFSCEIFIIGVVLITTLLLITGNLRF